MGHERPNRPQRRSTSIALHVEEFGDLSNVYLQIGGVCWFYTFWVPQRSLPSFGKCLIWSPYWNHGKRRGQRNKGGGNSYSGARRIQRKQDNPRPASNTQSRENCLRPRRLGHRL